MKHRCVCESCLLTSLKHYKKIVTAELKFGLVLLIPGFIYSDLCSVTGQLSFDISIFKNFLNFFFAIPYRI